MIGPVLPYRGGISHYTTELHRSLSKKCNLYTVSFKRQYPKILYPGKSDIEQKIKYHKENGVEYIIDSINPFSWKKAVKYLKKNKVETVIIMWWSIYWFFCFRYMAKFLRKRGIKVLFLCHNIYDHESSGIKKYLSKKILNKGTHYLVHSSEALEQLKSFVGSGNIISMNHPVYNRFPFAKGILKRRARLELLFFGIVRAYKGIDMLLDALEILKNEDLFLTIAGEWWIKDKNLLLKSEKLKSRCEVINKYVSEDDLAEYFARCDAVVLPYKSSHGSGVIEIALHYRKPVIATKVGDFVDKVKDNETGFLIDVDNCTALIEAVKKLFDEKTLSRLIENIVESSKNRKNTWENFADNLISFIK